MRKFVVMLLVLSVPGSARAQQSKQGWDALYSIRSGEKIEVVETNMKKHAGRFATVSNEAIEIHEPAGDVGIRKENVARVTLLDRSHRLRNALIFGATGLGAGIGIGAASNPHDVLGRDAGMILGGVIGLAGGATIGAAVSSHPTVYRAEPVKSPGK